MKCIEIQDQLTDYLENSLSEVANSDIKEHLKSCEICANELEEIKSFLAILESEKIETPSTSLKENFNKMLAKEISTSSKVVTLKPTVNWKSYLKVAASVALIISAFLFGKNQSKLTQFAIENEENKKEVLALLEDTSASKRILAVTNAEEFTSKDTKIIEALINRLFFDKNANVRSAAAEALSKFSSEIIVRDALIKALETDENTSVQIELIQILVKIEEKRAIEPLKNLLNKEKTPEYVKQQVELNLPSLL